MFPSVLSFSMKVSGRCTVLLFYFRLLRKVDFFFLFSPGYFHHPRVVISNGASLTPFSLVREVTSSSFFPPLLARTVYELLFHLN